MSAMLVIVRHGNTFGPDEHPRRIGFRTDLPLVDSGRRQAQRLGTYFAERGWHFDRILSSSLRRAYETAEAICSAQTCPPRIESSELLAEIDHGPDEGCLDEQVRARIGDEALQSWDTKGLLPPGWTTDIEARLSGWRQLFARNHSGSTLLVTSNGAARFALLADPNLTCQARQLPSLKLRTGAFGLILIGGSCTHLATWDERP